MLGGVDGVELGDLTPQLRELGPIVPERLVVQYIGERFGRAPQRYFVAGLLGDAVGLRRRQIPLQPAQLVFEDADLLGRKHQPGLAGVGLQAVFGALELDAHVLQLLIEPTAGLVGGFAAGFEILRNDLARERVGERGGHRRIGGIDADLENPALSGAVDPDFFLSILQG